MRAGAYCFGLIYGYLLYRIQSAEYKLTKVNWEGKINELERNKNE